eukprot:UN29464
MHIFRIQMHRHEYDKVFAAVYYFTLLPEELGLNEYPYYMPRPWTPFVLDSMDDLWAFKKQLLERVADNQEQILCMQEGHNTDADGFKRKMNPCCRIPTNLDVGTPITIVWFLKTSNFDDGGPIRTQYGINHHAVTYFDYYPLGEYVTQAHYLNTIGCSHSWCESACHGKCAPRAEVSGGIPVLWPLLLDMKPLCLKKCQEKIDDAMRQKMLNNFAVLSKPETYYNKPFKVVRYLEDLAADQVQTYDTSSKFTARAAAIPEPVKCNTTVPELKPQINNNNAAAAITVVNDQKKQQKIQKLVTNLIILYF